MPRDHYGTNRDQSEYYGALQNLVDSLFPDDEYELGDAARVVVSDAGAAATCRAGGGARVADRAAPRGARAAQSAAASGG